MDLGIHTMIPARLVESAGPCWSGSSPFPRLHPASASASVSAPATPGRGSLGKGNGEITKEGDRHAHTRRITEEPTPHTHTHCRFPYPGTCTLYFYRTHPRHSSRSWARGFPKNRSRSMPACLPPP
ncbi:hypothetical protein CLIM01_13568 [Colletotrichum limetticola]|uniref:Uncharacterized protein n=1 Tax=Colletotrichum limetticola TaxID=1209924 RepID=A0ABQ9PBM1_9PEZI|nr:hypothetical protein CLIM01_13568 [Colletotrichum limetticola]